MSEFEEIHIVDSHTAGEPTRLIISGGPDLGLGSMADRRDCFEKQWDHIRRAVVNEPRGSDVIVGGMLCTPEKEASASGVIFFNNVGYLNMCGHGSIGLGVTLAYLGRIASGLHGLETPVGDVSFSLLDRNTVEINNVPSYRHAADVPVQVDGLGEVVGDIAWGGNWFFLVKSSPIPLDFSRVDELTHAARKVMTALGEQGVTGANEEEIDHIEFFGPPRSGPADSRNFVLCPGGIYDRSPCGTGTSAKLACLAADGLLAPGEPWVQESIIGSTFTGSYELNDAGEVLPRIRGQAFVTSDARLLMDPADPFAAGI